MGQVVGRGMRRLFAGTVRSCCVFRNQRTTWPAYRRWHSGRAGQTVLKGKYDDPWKTLGVSRDTSEAEVKKAYIQMAKKHHPDRTGGDDAAFKRVKEAYDMIKSGDAERMYPKAGAHPGTAGGGAQQWGPQYGGFARQQGQAPPEGYQYSSSHTTYDRFGGEETVYTFRDGSGSTFTYVERKEGGDTNFWHAFQKAQQEALRQEAERMRARAADNEQYEKIFRNWAGHKFNDTIEYQDYVRHRDKAFYRFLLVWLWIFLALRVLINMFV